MSQCSVVQILHDKANSMDAIDFAALAHGFAIMRKHCSSIASLLAMSGD